MKISKVKEQKIKEYIASQKQISITEVMAHFQMSYSDVSYILYSLEKDKHLVRVSDFKYRVIPQKKQEDENSSDDTDMSQENEDISQELMKIGTMFFGCMGGNNDDTTLADKRYLELKQQIQDSLVSFEKGEFPESYKVVGGIRVLDKDVSFKIVYDDEEKQIYITECGQVMKALSSLCSISFIIEYLQQREQIDMYNDELRYMICSDEDDEFDIVDCIVGFSAELIRLLNCSKES